MADFLTQVAQFLESLIITIGYPGVFLVMFAENLFTPIPTEPFLPLAGVLAGQGRFTFVGVWALATAGAVSGSLVLYGLGKWAGEPAVRSLLHRYGRYIGISETELDRGMNLFNRYGAPLVFFGRLIPMVRPTVSLVAGLCRLPLAVFVLFTALSSAIVNAFWVGVGYFLGENWQQILKAIDQYEPLLWLIGGALAVVVVLFMALKWLRRRTVAAD